MGIDPAELAFGAGSVWVYDPVDGLAVQLDPNLEQQTTVSRFSLSPCPERGIYVRYGCKLGGIAFGNHRVWIGRAVGSGGGPGPGGHIGGIWRVDPRTPRSTRTPTVANIPAAQLAYGAGSIWTSSWWVVARRRRSM